VVQRCGFSSDEATLDIWSDEATLDIWSDEATLDIWSDEATLDIWSDEATLVLHNSGVQVSARCQLKGNLAATPLQYVVLKMVPRKGLEPPRCCHR
jgi:hypothetical protein